jgi:chromosome segregation ATPase
VVRNLLSGCDGGSSLSIRTLNTILVRQSDAFISADSFEIIEKEAAQEQAAEQAAAAKRAWMEEEQSIYEDILTRIQATEDLRQEAEAILDDPMKKQEMVVRCRLELKALQHAALNVKDVSKKLDIVVSFLSNINGQLSEMDKKLDMIQQDIASIRSDLKRLVGRPPLDVISDWRRKYLLEISEELPSREAYVEAEVYKAGPKGECCIQ